MTTRKAYSTPEQQAEANKRYFENNKEAAIKRKVKNYKWSGKNFILNYANEEDLKEYEQHIKIRYEELVKQPS